ncbi:MAG: hypothetical protein KIT84_28645 [Labilithrix sp.]|nr:hypothetical protein [Labilithrix sp.]MCW5815029.1 hypothetical protein [Labilithrix sp.]
MARDREGQLLDGRYLIEGPAEDGYAATDLRDGKRVHISFVPRAAVAGARRARDLTGAHVVRVLDVGDTAEGAAWIAREHVASSSLRRHLARKGPLTTHDAIEVALGVCDAVAEANGYGLAHGAIDASNVYLAWSASGLVDVQLAGIGSVSDVQPRDDVRSIAKLIDTMLAGRVPADLRAVLARGAYRAIDLADALTTFAKDPDFAGDRVAMRRHRSAMSTTVIASGAYPQSAFPTPPVPLAELAPAVRDLAPRARKRSRKHSISRDLPTVIAPRPSPGFSRRRAVRILGVATAAISVALLVLIGTEGARIAQTSRSAAVSAPPVVFTETNATNETTATTDATPPAPASIVPPLEAAPPPSAAPMPITRAADLPPAKPTKKRR